MVQYFKRNRIHFIGWALLYGVDLITSYFANSLQPWYFYLIFYSTNLILYYTVFRLGIALGGWKKQWGVAILLLLFIGVFFYIFCQINVWVFYLHSGVRKELDQVGYARIAWRCGTIITYGVVSYLIYRNGELKRKELEKEASRLKLEADLLKVQKALSHSQNSQHLIANCLTFVNNEIYKKAPDAGIAVSLANELLDYGMNVPLVDGKVPLFEELQQVTNMIALQKLISGIDFDFDLKITLREESLQKGVLPYLLLTFIDNIFRHGDLTTRNNSPIIRIYDSGNFLFFEAQNSKFNTHTSTTGHGLGIESIKTRMAYYYEISQYALIIQTEPLSYSVTLKVAL